MSDKQNNKNQQSSSSKVTINIKPLNGGQIEVSKSGNGNKITITHPVGVGGTLNSNLKTK